ncbi:hypothetical protein ABPG74_009443 [Tetrahymena malaccensis]
MGCVSHKSRNRSTIVQNLTVQNEYDCQQALHIINSINNTVKKLEQYYSQVISMNEQIPEKFAMLSPQYFLQQIRQNNLLTQIQIEEIEQKFLILFTDLHKNINTASNFLHFNKKMQSSLEEKKFILKSLVLKYENICIQFFAYLKENDQKRLTQDQINLQHRIKRAFTKNNNEENYTSLNLSTQESKRQIDLP